MDNLPLEVTKQISQYICCKDTKIYLVSKIFNRNKSCTIIKHKDLIECCHYQKSDKYIIIDKLNQFRTDTTTIHFTVDQMNIAKPYLYGLGNFSHFCCNDTGAMYKTKLNKKFDF